MSASAWRRSTRLDGGAGSALPFVLEEPLDGSDSLEHVAKSLGVSPHNATACRSTASRNSGPGTRSKITSWAIESAA
jgi:hypothetical protein